jgi:N-succinyldiaminopimelate aminotransferase
MRNPLLDDLPDYPFDRLRALLGGLAAPAGVAPITLTVGEPQHSPPPQLAQSLAENAHLWNHYVAVEGTASFRAVVAAWLVRRYGLRSADIDPDRHVLPAAGSREALYLIGHVVIPPEKRGRRPVVVMPNPYYQVYSAAPAATGAESVYLPALPENDFLPDVAGLDPDLLDRTALVYACSPSNPQGTVASIAYWQRLIELARRHDFVIVADECYAEIYDRVPPPGILEAAAALGGGFANVLAFHTLSKRSNAPGLRSGFVAGDPDLLERFQRFRSYTCTFLSRPVLAASEALWRDEVHVDENRRRYRAKLDVAEELLAGRAGFYRPPGGFFLWLDVGDGEAMARRLWTEAGVRVLPGAYIAHEPPGQPNPGASHVRVALVHDEATTREALTRIARYL